MSDHAYVRARLAQLDAVLPAARAHATDLRQSWLRSVEGGVELGGLETVFVGRAEVDSVLETCALRLLESNPPQGSLCVLVADAGGVVRVRRDGDSAFARVLDSLGISTGFDVGELRIGTTALALAISTRRDSSVASELHYHPQLTGVVDAAAIVCEEAANLLRAVVWVIAPVGCPEDLLCSYARTLAADLSRQMAGEASRPSRTVFDRFSDVAARRTGWVIGTDGSHTYVNDTASRLDPADLRALSDRATAAFVLRDVHESEANLPSGVLLDLTIEAVEVDGDFLGTVLFAEPCTADHGLPSEASRRQGAHVTSGIRRDFAKELRGGSNSQASGSVSHPVHHLESARDTGDLLTPYARARHDVSDSIRAHRHHLLIGEAGSGKRSLVSSEFRSQHPDGRVLTADCARFSGDTLPIRSASGALFSGGLDDGPYLLLIGGLEALTPLAARRLDELLRPLASGATSALLVGSVNDVTVDASKPYGLVMRYFHETIRVPPLRLRAEEIAEIAREILRGISGGSSLRLGAQATRVLEGYSWPGNVSEFEDVLRYVVARKPVGEIQARDLPAACFNGRSRRLSLLEAAQCEAIIQALYEAKGNRYRAAAALGIARSSLYRKIDAFGISYIS